MTTVNDIVSALEAFAPPGLRREGDNCGLLVGRGRRPVRSILVSLDVTAAVVAEAVSIAAELIVAHHPVFFQLGSLTDRTAEGRIALALAEAGVAACCMHTNLDFAARGVNFCLAEALGLSGPYAPIRPFLRAEAGAAGEGIVGRLDGKHSAGTFAARIKASLGCGALRLYDAGRPVSVVGVCSGSGASLFDEAVAAGCDTYVTGECKYHLYLHAAELGVNLIEAGHFETENVICSPLRDHLRAVFSGLNVELTSVHTGPYRCL